MRSRAHILSLACLAAATACIARAQPLDPTRLEPVNPGLDDVGPLSRSFRVQPTDLRWPTDFDRVYRHPTRPGEFIRISGGLTAVFPRSQYVQVQDGYAPVVPPGTVYVIGTPRPPEPWEIPSLDSPHVAALRRTGVGTRLDLRVSADAFQHAQRRPSIGDVANAGQPASWFDEPARQRRVESLLRKAQDAQAQGDRD
ncbi:MAG: hypothetical protein H6811_06630 [Phycisphaeraceae bacterium]|nr:hypothetical protein [Phycisphaeraceae bacterium]